MTANELRAERKRLGLSQPQLAALLGVDVMTINRWETGKRPAPPYIAYTLRGIACEREHGNVTPPSS